MFLNNQDAPSPLANLILRAPTPEEIKLTAEAHAEPVNASPSFPFGIPENVSAIGGPIYLTAQDLVQQVAYSLSRKIFSYSPDTFALDAAAKLWSASGQKNAFGEETSITSMQTRTGAASVLLGYVFSSDSSASKKNVPQSVIASTATLLEMRNALDQLALLYSASTPFVAHVAAVDYSPFSNSLVTDYTSALRVAQDTGVGLVTSSSTHETQHMALFATAISPVLPTVHVYDGVKQGRESTRVVDVLEQTALLKSYQKILENQPSSIKREDASAKVSRILSNLNAELGTSYSLFEYAGHETPETVLVVFGSTESSLATQVASTLAATGQKIGVIAVRVYRPFVEEAFLERLPESVKRVAVLGQVACDVDVEDRTVQSPLYEDVLATLTMSDRWTLAPPVTDVKYSREQALTPSQVAWIFEQLSNGGKTILANTISSDTSIAPLNLNQKEEVSEFLFVDSDDSELANVPASVARFLASDSTQNVSYNISYDNLTEAGIAVTQVRSSKKVIDAPYSIDNAEVVVINDTKLLSALNVVNNIKPGATLLLRSGIKDEDIEKQLTPALRKSIAKKGIKLNILSVPPQDEGSSLLEAAKLQLVFLGFIGADISSPSAVEKALHYVNISVDDYLKIIEDLSTHVRNFEVPASWAEVEEEETAPSTPPYTLRATSFSVNEAKHEVEAVSILRSSQQAAIALSFKEAYHVNSALRPDLPTRNFILKVKENKRLTPLSYDRNIFHIEFDTTGTGMKYEIGEALGIHAHNDPAEVDQFIKSFDLNPDDIVEVASRDDPEILEMRTVHQALLQNVDIFGKPPKRFYESLAEFATDENEKKSLLTLASPEGAVEFKRRAEVDTVTYADILQEFPSARPDFHQLVRIISPLKRREYSIASSQVVNPTSVHLLIVVVNWRDPTGRDRFGQATRYLSRLPVGAEVTVSVKPSVMKLPPLSTQPLIMAGLGTGLAPFRAFVQYRAWQKSQGIPIGEVLLYMGARHQREEYLYGEEWEAYEAAGVITRIGKAFSRDQPQKIYIQDRMRQSLDDIVDAYLDKEGAFYLCGPTWPVPDVSQVLMEAIGIDAKRKGKKVDERRAIETMKDAGRYVLEVY